MPAERGGEVIFNTALTGYQEAFTGSSYSWKIAILTIPQIGNYGPNSLRVFARSQFRPRREFLSALVSLATTA